MDIDKILLLEKSAYHGGSWNPRSKSHSSECLESNIWRSNLGYDSEYSKLEEVLLLDVNDDFPDTSQPENIQFLHPIDPEKLKAEYKKIEFALIANHIKIHKISMQSFSNPSANLLFCRDLFFSTPYGVILGRMGSYVRAGEEKFAQLALAKLGIPILKTISGKGTFEGADALFLNSKTILVGVGNRTNIEGFLQIQQALNEFGINCIKISLPKKTQHLLGILQIIDSNIALVRTEIALKDLIEVLDNFKIIPIQETQEVVFRQALNFLTIGPQKVIMASQCPDMKALLEKTGIEVCAEVAIDQLISGAGGLACATGILTRKLRSEEI
jgi:N-dimethylarginine dimethylaminohydrolase